MSGKSYKISFQIVDEVGYIFEYETDIIPPQVGEMINLALISNNSASGVFKIKEVWHTPVSDIKDNVAVTLETYKE